MLLIKDRELGERSHWNSLDTRNSRNRPGKFSCGYEEFSDKDLTPCLIVSRH